MSYLQSTSSHQFTLVDVTYDWKETTYFVRALNELGDQPVRWDQPVDYANGTIFGRLHVLEKPSDLELLVQFCFWQDGNETCKKRDVLPITFSAAETYYFSIPAPGRPDNGDSNDYWLRCKGEAYFNPSQQVEVLQVQYWARNVEGDLKVVREKGKHWPRDRNEDMGAEVRQHIPIRQRLELIVVPVNATFQIPDHWGGAPDIW